MTGNKSNMAPYLHLLFLVMITVVILRMILGFGYDHYCRFMYYAYVLHS